MSDDRNTRAAVHQSLSRIESQRITGAAIALLRKSGSMVSQLGSGSLFVVADQYFVVTAGHVVAEAIRLGSALGVAGGNGTIVDASGNWICSNPRLDVGIHRLSSKQVESLSDKTFLRLSDVELANDLSHALFLIFGFLRLLSFDAHEEHQKVGLGALRLGATLADVDTTGLDGYIPAVHFLLHTPDEELFGPDGDETTLRDKGGRHRVRLVDGMPGASGSAVWRLREPELASRNLANAANWRVAGVLTGNYGQPRELVKVTRWSAVLLFMYEVCPDLRNALRIALPH